MISPQLYQALVMEVIKNGKYEQRRINGTLYRIYKLSELTLMLSQNENNKWKPDGINIEIFDIELFFSSDGNVSITENEDNNDPDVYSITEESLLQALASFLKWRLSVIMSLGV